MGVDTVSPQNVNSLKDDPTYRPKRKITSLFQQGKAGSPSRKHFLRSQCRTNQAPPNIVIDPRQTYLQPSVLAPASSVYLSPLSNGDEVVPYSSFSHGALQQDSSPLLKSVSTFPVPAPSAFSLVERVQYSSYVNVTQFQENYLQSSTLAPEPSSHSTPLVNIGSLGLELKSLWEGMRSVEIDAPDNEEKILEKQEEKNSIEASILVNLKELATIAKEKKQLPEAFNIVSGKCVMLVKDIEAFKAAYIGLEARIQVLKEELVDLREKRKKLEEVLEKHYEVRKKHQGNKPPINVSSLVTCWESLVKRLFETPYPCV